MPQILVVTGAARGIGASIARAAAQRGYAVAVNYARSASDADAVVRSIIATGGHAVAIQADVSTPDGAAKLFAGVDQQLGRADVLVNNAGKRRRMRWSPRGAHCVATVRAAVLDGRLNSLASMQFAA